LLPFFIVYPGIVLPSQPFFRFEQLSILKSNSAVPQQLMILQSHSGYTSALPLRPTLELYAFGTLRRASVLDARMNWILNYLAIVPSIMTRCSLSLDILPRIST
jgi:hypothetical protein